MPPRRSSTPRSPLGKAWPRYRTNLARHLIGLDRALQRDLMEHLAGRGFTGLRLSFTPVLARVAEGPQSLGALADTLDVSAQAASQLVKAIESADLVERRRDPNDGRSWQITLTARGRALLTAAAARIAKTLDAWAEPVGEAQSEEVGEGVELRLMGIGGRPPGGDGRASSALCTK